MQEVLGRTLTDNKGNITKFRADKIKGFEKGGKYYFSKNTEDTHHFFIERIIKGKINLYTFRFHASVQEAQVPIVYYFIEYYIEGDKDNLIKLNYLNIEDFIKENFSNHPKFVNKLTEKKDVNKLFREEKYVFNTLEYILEIVQLYDLLQK